LLDCGVGELIEPVTAATASAATKPRQARPEQRDAPAQLRPTRARIAPVRPVP
jgi:hypothetical protein